MEFQNHRKNSYLGLRTNKHVFKLNYFVVYTHSIALLNGIMGFLFLRFDRLIQ